MECTHGRQEACDKGQRGLVGAGLGVIVSFIVNITLVEISISPFFSLCLS